VTAIAEQQAEHKGKGNSVADDDVAMHREKREHQRDEHQDVEVEEPRRHQQDE
jgi:hypothetical protein